MIMITDSVKELKRFLSLTSLKDFGLFDGDADDAGVHVASWEDVLLLGRRGNLQRTGPSRADHAVPG